MSTVHLLCAVHNGAPYLPAFLESVRAQTHSHWTLWLLDDHSRDESAAIIAAAATTDSRLQLLPSAPTPLGALGAFARLWEQLPPEAEYIAFADQDDVWHPTKVADALAALQRVEEGGTMPALVHTDLAVVGPALEPIAPSYWAHAGIVPEPPTLRRIVAQNVVTGCTMLLNRALYDAVGPIPAGATMHDAWVACVAAAVGRIVALPRPTVQYRQHGKNTLGAHQTVHTRAWYQLIPRLWRALATTGPIRRQIAGSAAQASLLLERYAHRLSPADQDFLQRYAQIPRMTWWHRKRAVALLHLHPQHHWLTRLGVLWRA